MMNRVDVNAVLMQMRQVKSQIRSNYENNLAAQDVANNKPALTPQHLERPVAESKPVSSVSESTTPDFQTMFKNAIDNVNANQKAAGELATRFEQGDPSVDLPEVMIALQKSSVSFQAMTQVRNKLVEAYKDVMNMPV